MMADDPCHDDHLYYSLVNLGSTDHDHDGMNITIQGLLGSNIHAFL